MRSISQLNCIFSFRFNTETVSPKLFEKHLICMYGYGRKVARFTSFSFAPKAFTEVILLFMSLKVCCLITLLYLCISARQIMMRMFALSLCLGLYRR